MQWRYREKRNYQEQHENVFFIQLIFFYYYKIRPRNRKNFAMDRSKLVFRYLIISLLQRFVSSSNCKEKLNLKLNCFGFKFQQVHLVQKQSPGGVLLKRFLRNSQNSQENNCTGISYFNKVTGLRPTTLLKRDSARKCFPVNFANFLRAFKLFYRTPLVAAASFRLKLLVFINCFAINCFGS